MRKALSDPAFWILLVINASCLKFYSERPDSLGTLLWIYWLQSVLIGIFHFFDLLTVKDPIPGSLTINNQPIDKSNQKEGCASGFFLFHYQFFHLVYAIFLATAQYPGIDFLFIKISAAVIVLELTISLIRNKRLQNTMQVNYGLLFFLPYVRIIPMHLFILLPSFLGIKASFIFLLLKAVADIGMYLLTRALYEKPAPSNG